MPDITPDGPAPLTIYDVSIDERRAATQADIDMIMRALTAAIAALWLAVEREVRTAAPRTAKVRS